MGRESFDVVTFAVDPSFNVRQPNLKVLITRLLFVLEACGVKPTYRKSWAGNLLMWPDLTFETEW